MVCHARCRVGLIALGVLLGLAVGVATDAAPKRNAKSKSATAPAAGKTEAPSGPAPNVKPATSVKLPAPVDAAIAGGGGKYLILHLKKLQQLAVFDVGQSKVVKYLPIPSNDIAFAAGADKLFIALRDLKQLQRWSLADFKLESSVVTPERGIGALSIGAGSTGPVVAVGDQHAKRLWQIDPKTLRAEASPSKNWGNDGSAWGPVNVHVSFDGTTVVTCGGGWAGIELGTITAGRVTGVEAGSYNNGEALVAGNGQLVFPGQGGALRRDLASQVPGIEGQAFPADDPGFSLAFKQDRKSPPALTLFSNADPRPLMTLIGLTELAEKSPLPIWQRVHLIPKFKSLVTLAASGDELLVRPFDLTEQLKSNGVDYLFVESIPPAGAERGKPYAYDLQVQSKRGEVKLELQAGPPGMTLAPDGKLRWNVPASIADTSVTVIIQVGDAGGQTIFHSFMIALPKPLAQVASAGAPQPPPADKPTKTAPPAKSTKRPEKSSEPSPEPSAAPPAVGAAKVVQLAEPFAEFHAAAGGRRLVFHQPKAKQLAVHDADTGKQLGVIRLGADNVRFTCGKDVVVVALPDQRILQTYNLTTFKRLKSAPFPNTQPLKELKMGSASDEPLLLYFGGEMQAMNVSSLTPMKLRGKMPAGNPDWRFDYRVSADGSTVVCWDSYASPSTFSITRIAGGKVSTVESGESFSMANRRFTPTANGTLVVYETAFYNAAGRAIDANLKGYENCVPTADPRFLIAVKSAEGHKSDLALCTAADRRIISQWKGVSDVGDTGGFDRGRCGIVIDMKGAGEPRVVLTPDTKTLALIPAGNDRIELLPVDLNGGAVVAGAPASKGAAGDAAAVALAVVSLPPTEVPVGATYSYQVQVVPEKAKVQYKLESGPKGMSVSGTGLLTWKVSERPVGGKVNVILSLTDPAGNEVPHAFDIAVTREALAKAGSADAPASSTGGGIVRLDEHRIELPSEHVRYVPGMGGRALILCDDQLAVVASDGFTIKESRALPKSYVGIGERADYYVAISQDPRSIDVLDKRTLKVLRNRPIAFQSLTDLALHPERPISYVMYSNAGEIPRHHFLIFDERTGQAATDDNWIGQWGAAAPTGKFLLTGFQETYRKGHDIIDNPDRIWIVPTYGSIDSMARYDLDDAGVPVRVAHKEGVGGNGVGIRLSPDGKRATYLSVAGYPDFSHNLAGWDPLNLRALPVAYLCKDAGSPTDLAFHPLLPLVATPGKATVALFDRETGEPQRERISEEEIAGEDVRQAYFSPDGKSILMHTVVQSVHYLYHTSLKLSADEIKAVRALPRPDQPMRPEKRPVSPPAGGSRKLPQVQARRGEPFWITTWAHS